MKKVGSLIVMCVLLCAVSAFAKDYKLQVDAINFLTGGKDDAGVHNKVIDVSDQDNNRSILISQNSAVVLTVSSHMGNISLIAKSTSGEDLGSVMGAIQLGEPNHLVQFRPYNSVGFSFMNIQDVTPYTAAELKALNAIADAQAEAIAKALKQQQ